MSVDTNYRAGIKLQFKNEWGSFVATFMRFEYALKNSGYLKYDKLGATAEAGWAVFAADLGPEFLAKCRAMPELSVLFVSPPRLLKVDANQKVSWKKARAVNSVADFFQVIKDVHSNLFHGETRVHGERDGDLIEAAQYALDYAWEEALKLEGNIKLLRFAKHFPYQQ
jgi:hypothetical protein